MWLSCLPFFHHHHHHLYCLCSHKEQYTWIIIHILLFALE
jgi:hypothetical protein